MGIQMSKGQRSILVALLAIFIVAGSFTGVALSIAGAYVIIAAVVGASLSYPTALVASLASLAVLTLLVR